jgi:hypothetical protein
VLLELKVRFESELPTILQGAQVGFGQFKSVVPPAVSYLPEGGNFLERLWWDLVSGRPLGTTLITSTSADLDVLLACVLFLDRRLPLCPDFNHLVQAKTLVSAAGLSGYALLPDRTANLLVWLDLFADQAPKDLPLETRLLSVADWVTSFCSGGNLDIVDLLPKPGVVEYLPNGIAILEGDDPVASVIGAYKLGLLGGAIRTKKGVAFFAKSNYVCRNLPFLCQERWGPPLKSPLDTQIVLYPTSLNFTTDGLARLFS